jgi:hypothetical protein
MCNPRLITAAALLMVVGIIQLPTSAFALTAEIAKKCSASKAKQFPPRSIGNPAAGSAKGSGADERAFFSKCVTENEKKAAETTGQSSK